MNKPTLRMRVALLLGIFGLAMSGWAHADPPSRVARLAYTSGAISFSPGGEDDWVQAAVNRPLTTGDRLWADAGGRAELQLGDVAIRMAANTSLTLLNLDDRATQVQLAQGTLNLRVRHLDRDESFEVDTPNLAYSIRRPGSYRIEVDADGTATGVVVRDGQAEVTGEGSAFLIDAGQADRFYGTGLRDYESVALSAPDDFDRWSGDRDRRWDNSSSARYVSRSLIGYEDLDEHGTWRNVDGYGNVWSPNRVAANWAPYRDGHWAWVEPWGWTWVDDAAWGFAPSHYGRWAHIDGAWGWIPGPVAARPVYAPALVAFVGGSNFQISLGAGSVPAVAWFPLGPRDVYRPSYPVSRDYFGKVNSSSTVINTTNITNVYNTTNTSTNVTNVVYVNQQVPGAVVAVPRAVFAQSRPIAKEALPLSREAISSTPVMAVASVAPVHTSVLGASAASKVKPPQAVLARPVVVKMVPPPAPIPFAARQGTSATNPGMPLDAAATAAVKPAAPLVPSQVRVVTAPPPVPLPSRPASAAGRRPEPAKASAPAAVPTQVAEPARPGPASAPRVVDAARVALPPAGAVVPRNAGNPNAGDQRTSRPPGTVPRPPEPATPVAAAPPPASVPAPAASTAINVARPPQVAKPVPPPHEAEPRQAATLSSAAVPHPLASASAPVVQHALGAAPPPPRFNGAEQRVQQPAPEPARAIDRSEAASDARKGDEPRKPNQAEPGRGP